MQTDLHIRVGAVVQFVGVGAAAGKTQESFYLVKDTDTVALERPSEKGNLKFAWQFRPVLGRRTIEPGIRQVFALISVPAITAKELKVTAVTKWRRYDRKTKAVGQLINGAPPNTQYANQSLVLGYRYDTESQLKPRIHRVVLSDTGNGQVLAVVEGEGFTPDTSIVLGNTVLSRPEHGLTIANERRLLVVAPGQLLARSLPRLVGRYGTTEFTRPLCVGGDFDKPCVNIQWPYLGVQLLPLKIQARDPVSSEVTINLRVRDTFQIDLERMLDTHKPVVIIGDRVFGLSDAPFISREFFADNREATLRFIAPTQLLANSRTLTFKEFLWNNGPLTADLSLKSFSVTGLTTLGTNGEKTQLAISGGGFTNKVRVWVGDVEFRPPCARDEQGCTAPTNLLKLSPSDGPATLITLSPTKAQMKDIKYILVLQDSAQPQSLVLKEPPPAVPTAKIISPAGLLQVGEGDSRKFKFEGANFESIKKVVFEGKDVQAKPDENDKTVLWVTLETFLTGVVGQKQIIFVMKDDKEVPFTIEVLPRGR